MTETVIVALIGATQAILVALLVRQSSRMKGIERDARTTAAQTQNSHGTNLRDDLDEHRDILGTILARLKDQGGAVIGIRKDLRHLREVDLEQQRATAEHQRATTEIDKKLDAHLEWSRLYVEKQKGKS